MPFTTSYVVQGQNKQVSVSETGDYNGITTTVPFGATRVSAVELVPDTIRELIIDTDVACTVDFGDEDPLVLSAGKYYEWHLSSGAPCYFTGASAVPFTMINTAGSGTGEIRIAWKTPEPS